MLKFFAPNDPNYFDYVVKITPNGDGSEFSFTSIYKKNDKTANDLNKSLGRFCFPYKEVPFPPAEKLTFSFAFTDENKKNSYGFVHSQEIQGVRTAFALVSNYFHPSLFCEIVTAVCDLYIKNPQEAENYLSNLLHLQLIRRPYDWSFTMKAGLNIKNVDHLSPDNEISKLLNFMFVHFSINDILSTIVALLLDCKIIVLSSHIELLGQTIFAILGLIYPLQWQNAFIPLLPSVLEEFLGSPMAYIIGVHSSMASLLLQETVDRYFVLNPDCHYSVIIGMDDYPAEILDQIDKSAEDIRAKLSKYKPIFPAHSIQKKIRKFILNVFSTAYGGCDTSGPAQLFKAFSQYRDIVSEEFNAIISQTQFVDVFMRQIMQDFDDDGDKEAQQAHSLEVLKAFWPKTEFSTSTTERRRRRTTKKPTQKQYHSTLRINKSKGIGIQPKAKSKPKEDDQMASRFLSLRASMVDFNKQSFFELADESQDDAISPLAENPTGNASQATPAASEQTEANK